MFASIINSENENKTTRINPIKTIAGINLDQIDSLSYPFLAEGSGIQTQMNANWMQMQRQMEEFFFPTPSFLHVRVANFLFFLLCSLVVLA